MACDVNVSLSTTRFRLTPENCAASLAMAKFFAHTPGWNSAGRCPPTIHAGAVDGLPATAAHEAMYAWAARKISSRDHARSRHNEQPCRSSSASAILREFDLTQSAAWS